MNERSMVADTDYVQVSVAVVCVSASADSLFATSLSWWERLPEALSGSRLQPGFSIRVSTAWPTDLGEPQFARGTSQDMTRSPAKAG